MCEDVLKALYREKIIAIVRNVSADNILMLGDALRKSGIICIEVAFDSRNEGMDATLECIRRLSSSGQFCVGAGTVLTSEQVERAADAGAEYIISPNTDEMVIERTKSLGKVSIPGAFSASEVVRAFAAGGDIVKIFPSKQLGAGYIKALQAPLGHIPMMAVGGITPENCREFVKAGAICVGCGGNLVNPEAIRCGREEIITETARLYRKALDKI